MIDFHCHILPNLDDGSESVDMSLTMLRRSFLQGVDLVMLTPHFYADEEYPEAFLRRRKAAFEILQDAMLLSPEAYPNIMLGAEVLYFPGMDAAEDLRHMRMGNSRCVLVEPPMAPWSDTMLDEIARMGDHLGCVPVIAHVDRYMSYLHDNTLIDRVLQRKMVVQVNGDYFLNPKTVKSAMQNLRNGKIHLIGSDCHNLASRAPNLGNVWKQAKAFGVESEFRKLHENAVNLLLKGEL